MTVVIGFDFGTSSIGVAVGQDVTGTACPITAFKAKNGIPDWQKIEKLLNEWRPDYIVVGLPLNMDGTVQLLTTRAKKFATRLHDRFGYQVKLHDERLTTVEAKSHIFKHGGYRALQKDRVDSTSAVIILESWFDNQE